MGPNNSFGYQNPGMMPNQYQGSLPQSRGQSFQSFANGQSGQKQEPYLPCKFVDDPSRIMPIEVPQNGDPAFFIARDFSRIYVKAWNAQGTIDNVVYAPIQQVKPEDEQRAKDNKFQSSVLQRLGKLEGSLQTLLDSLMGTSSDPKQETKNS